MKCLLLQIYMAFVNPLPQDSLYTIQLTLLNQTTISTSSLRSKKIIIYEFDANNIDSSQLQFLDSLQKTNNNLKVIAVPSTDFSTQSNTISLSNSISALRLSIPVIQSTSIIKNSVNQNPLFNWLTHSTANGHFDNEVSGPGIVYLISENGILYSIIGSGTPKNIFFQILNQSSVQ